MKKLKNRKPRSPRAARSPRVTRIVSATILVGVLAAGFFAVNGQASSQAETITPTVGLVNEDLTAVFNGEEYLFGKNFVDRISKDAEYHWTVLSRPVAERAYLDGSLDAVVYIPQTFSTDLLTLNDAAPTKATVEYKLVHQADARADRLLESKITGIVHDFNQSVVKMYYASLADNIAGADSNMYAALSNQEALIAALITDVQDPYSGSMPKFESFISATTSLKDVNKATVEAQNSFTEMTTETLAATGDALSAQLPEVEKYAARQKEIAEINATNSNRSISDQAGADQSFYGGQYEALKSSMLCDLNGLEVDGAISELCLAKGDDPENKDQPLPVRQQLDGLRGTLSGYTADYLRSTAELRSELAEYQATLTEKIENLTVFAERFEPFIGFEFTGNTAPPLPTVLITQEEYDALQADIAALTEVRDSLNADALPTPNFDPSVDGLDAWYTDALSQVSGSTMAVNTVEKLTLRDWGHGDPDSRSVYLDGDTALQDQLAGLLASTAASSGRIGEAELSVQDNSALFDALLERATETHGDASSVLGGVNDLVASGTEWSSQGHDYYTNFSTVLANTRAPGADTAVIQDFFSAPIDAANITPKRAAVTESFNPMWVIVFGGGLLVGVLVAVFGGTFRARPVRVEARDEKKGEA